MQKVKLLFTLIGKSDSWQRKMTPEKIVECKNSDTLSYVCDVVSQQFGNRALVVVNQNRLEYGTYPTYYSAGWFISEGDNASELVVIDHGDTMKDATNSMFESIRNMNWNELAMPICLE